MGATETLAACLARYKGTIGKVVDFDASKDKLYLLDLTAANIDLSPELLIDTSAFTGYINGKIAENNCLYGIGGYLEHRTIYTRSTHFNTEDEPRRLHLGTDIWSNAGLPVYSPLDGQIHSFKDNNNFGDYGPTIILQHNLNGLALYSLYGHLSRQSLSGLTIGKQISANQKIATLGNEAENGQWPPHLHFQLMLDIGNAKGDYPGVGKYSQKAELLCNIPNPQLLLKLPDAVNA